MAVAADGTAVTGGGNGVNSFTLAAYSTAAIGRLIVCCVDNSNGSTSVQSVTGGSLLFSRVNKKVKSSGTTEMWAAIARNQLTAVVFTVTMVGSNSPQVSGNLLGYSGVDLTNISSAIEANATGGASTGTSISQAVTSLTDNSLGIAAMGKNTNGAFTAGSGQTIKGETSGGTVTRIALSEQNAATSPAGSITMSISWTGSTDNGAVCAAIAAAKPNQGYIKGNSLRPAIYKPGLAR